MGELVFFFSLNKFNIIILIINYIILVDSVMCLAGLII